MSIHVVNEGLFLPIRPDFADFDVRVEDSLAGEKYLNIMKYPHTSK